MLYIFFNFYCQLAFYFNRTYLCQMHAFNYCFYFQTCVLILRAMFEVYLKDSKRVNVLMQMFGLDETVDQLVVANSLYWYSDVFRSSFWKGIRI